MADETKKASKQYKGEFRIVRVSPMMKQDVKNIANNLGISMNDFIKTKLLDIISSYPAHYRREPLKD